MQAKSLRVIPWLLFPAAITAGWIHAPAVLRFPLAGLVASNGESDSLEGEQLLSLNLILTICLALMPAGEALPPLWRS